MYFLSEIRLCLDKQDQCLEKKNNAAQCVTAMRPSHPLSRSRVFMALWKAASLGLFLKGCVGGERKPDAPLA